MTFFELVKHATTHRIYWKSKPEKSQLEPDESDVYALLIDVLLDLIDTRCSLSRKYIETTKFTDLMVA